MRRHRQATTADVTDWTQAEGADVGDKAKVLARVVGEVIKHYDELDEIDQMFRRIAGNLRPNLEVANRAAVLSEQFTDYVALVDVTTRSIDGLPASLKPPSERLAELRKRRASAEEMASIYRGEAEYFRGDPEVTWEQFRKTLGV